MLSPRENPFSSSDDEDFTGEFHSNVSRPDIDLSKMRRGHGKKAKALNLAKVGKKLTGPQSRSGPVSALVSPHESVFFSTSNNATDSDSSDFEIEQVDNDPNLPSFRLNTPQLLEDFEDVSQTSSIAPNEINSAMEASSSSEESVKPSTDVQVEGSSNSTNREDEADITDLLADNRSHSILNRFSNFPFGNRKKNETLDDEQRIGDEEPIELDSFDQEVVGAPSTRFAIDKEKEKQEGTTDVSNTSTAQGILAKLLDLDGPQLSSRRSSFNLDSDFESPLHSKNSSMLDFTVLRSRLPKKRNSKSRSSIASDGAESIDDGLPSFYHARPKAPKKHVKSSKLPIGKRYKHHKKQQAQKLKITVHVADVIQRQRFIMRMCRALMLYGAPTHRLEEYMVMTSKVLEIDGQFIYFPGCMVISFSDPQTRASQVHLVRCLQSVNLSKLADTHAIYKEVIHDLIGVEDAASKLENLLKGKDLFSPWTRVFLYGLGSASVCPFAFNGNWYDIPISFGIGLCVGCLQFIVSSRSNLYQAVFEVTSSIVVSFIARAIGSIKGGDIFCYGAITQSSLALILPGYIILCGSLELQSKNLVSGSVRMFYAIIYSLFLGFGITLGAALYGWVDKDGTDDAQCLSGHKIDDKWRILFIPLFTVCLGLINQARWRQLPIMTFISCVGYIANYYAGKHFQDVTEFTAAIGAFIVGILGNMYSRLGKGMAVSAILPAIFVQVPSGIASKSTLLSGISSANQITHANSSTSSSSSDISSLSFGATMVEVSIGISVGLFAAALAVYPFGKKKTGLFTL